MFGKKSASLPELITQALRTVEDPDLKRDLVTLGMIEGLEVSPDGKVRLTVVLTTPACPLKEKIKKDVETAVLAVEGVKALDVTMSARVKKSGSSGGVQPIPGVAHVIAVSSGKGGVGKSTVAVNLALALAKTGAKVGLLDADVYGPNTPTMMGVTEQPKLIQDPKLGELFVPPISHGVKLMSMGFLIQGDQPLVWRGPMLHSVMSQFCHKVQWGELDYLVVDMPPGTGDVQLSLAQLVPVSGAVLVTTPQEVSLQDVRKAYHMFEKVRVPILGIVENMSYFLCDGCDRKHFLFGKDGGTLLAKKFGTEIIAQLPLVPSVREAGDEGRPVVTQNWDAGAPALAVAQEFLTLARKVAQKISILDRESAQIGEISIGKF